MQQGKPIAAAVFVALIVVLLTIPFREDDGSELGDAAESSPSAASETPEETEEPSPAETPTDGEAEDFPRTGVLGGTYPEGCLEQVDPPTEDLVAHSVPGGISVAAPGDGEGIVVGDEQAFTWSPSGTYLLTGSGTFYETGGAIADNLPIEASTFNWGWSPVSDCALIADGRGILVVQPNQEPVRIVFKPVERFAFSPTGDTLAYVRQGEDAGASIWQADLTSGDIEELARVGTLEEGEQVILAGWAPDGSDLFYWVGAKDRLLNEGVRIRSVSSEDPGPRVLAHTDFVTNCGERTLAVVGGGARTEASSKRLAFLNGGSPPDFVSEDGWAISPACSPDGGFIAAIGSDDATGQGARTLTLLDSSGGSLQTLDETAEFSDASPLWGRGDAGLLYLRVRADGQGAELWSAAPGGEPQATGIVMDEVPGTPERRRDAWGRFLDWSADSPTGISVTTEPAG
jgi:Tol biopolymer transport system component